MPPPSRDNLYERSRITDIAEFYRIPDRASAERSALLQNGVLGDMARLRRGPVSGS